MNQSRVVLLTRLLLFAGVLSVLFATCKYPNAPANPNGIPDTHIANVPANDEAAVYIVRNAFPEFTMYWVGNDQDGYVTAFQYRWTTTRPGAPVPVTPPWTTVLNLRNDAWQNVILVRGNPSSIFRIYDFLATLGQEDTSLVRIIGDSLATERAFAVPYRKGIIPTDSIAGASLLYQQTATIGTFIFYSPADSNKQVFEVRSVDNSDDVDPTPARVVFWTLRSPRTYCQILEVPVPNALCVSEKSDTFLGLRFRYQSLDENNTEQIQFKWSVDDTVHWSEWSQDNVAYVTAKDLRPKQSGAHVFHVRSRNRWGVESPDSSRVFTVSVPPIDDLNYPKRTLLINDDCNEDGTRGKFNHAQIDSLYREMMDSIGLTGRYDIWHVSTSGTSATWPSRDTLGYYTSVLFLMERGLPPFGRFASQKFNASQQSYFREYLNIGGKMIWVGTPNAPSSIPGFANGGIVSVGSWAYDIFHLNSGLYVMSPGLDFNGATGVRISSTDAYPDIPLDMSKIATDTTTALLNIGYIGINFPRGFGETISQYRSRSGGALDGMALGIRFKSAPAIPPRRQTYSTVYFGFGLCYAQKSAAIRALGKAFQDINE